MRRLVSEFSEDVMPLDVGVFLRELLSCRSAKDTWMSGRKQSQDEFPGTSVGPALSLGHS